MRCSRRRRCSRSWRRPRRPRRSNCRRARSSANSRVPNTCRTSPRRPASGCTGAHDLGRNPGRGLGQLGEFSSPFAEPGLDCPHGWPPDATEAKITCKPAAVNIVALPNGKLVYWDGLEAEEDVNLNVVAEIGDKAVNDQSRLLDLSGPSWSQPSRLTEAPTAAKTRNTSCQTLHSSLEQVLNDPGGAAGALFCSDQVLLPDGRVLTPGGTHYYSEPHVPESESGRERARRLAQHSHLQPRN